MKKRPWHWEKERKGKNEEKKKMERIPKQHQRTQLLKLHDIMLSRTCVVVNFNDCEAVRRI